jgi:hypothetical protein
VSTDVDDAYDILGVPRGASFEQVHKAWRRRQKQVHPDADSSRTPAQRARAEEQAKRINAAHQLLKERLGDGGAPAAPPTRPPSPAAPADDAPPTPEPWLEPRVVDFGRVTMADNGTEIRLDLCNRIGRIRVVTLLRLSGSFWRVEGGPVGRRPVRASFRVVLDIPPGFRPGSHPEVLEILAEGKELRVAVVATVVVRRSPAAGPSPVAAPPSSPTAPPPAAPSIPWTRPASWGTPPVRPRIRWGWVGAAAVCALVVIAIATQQNNSASPTPAGTVTSPTPSSGWTLTDAEANHNNVSLYLLDCPSAGLCVAADQVGGVITSTAPGSGAWAQALVFDNPSWNVETMQGLSCPSVNFCAGTAVTFAGEDQVATTTDPSGTAAWSVTNLFEATAPGYELETGIGAISCPSASLCVAVDAQGDVITSTNPTGGGKAWTLTTVDTQTGIDAISCPTTSLCVGVDNAGNVVVSTNPTGGASAWTMSNIDKEKFQDVSCPDANLCVASDNDGGVVVSTDPTGGVSAWKRVADVGGIDQLDGSSVADLGVVSCSSAGECVTASGNYVLVSYDPTGGASTWQTTDVNPNKSVNAVSCPSDDLCVAVDGYGDVLTGP